MKVEVMKTIEITMVMTLEEAKIIQTALADTNDRTNPGSLAVFTDINDALRGVK